MKKGMVFMNSLVEIILILLVFLVLLGFTASWSGLFDRVGKDQICQASFTASSTFSLLGKQTIDPKCKTNRITLTLDMDGETSSGSMKVALNKDLGHTLADNPDLAWDTFTRVRQWNRMVELDDSIPDSNKFTYHSEIGIDDDFQATTKEDKDYIRIRYNTDMILADEMKRCWDITGNGNLPLFDQYWNLIGCKDSKDGPVRECDNAKDFWTSRKDIKDTATFCVLCARIKPDEEISSIYEDMGPGIETDSINVWMSNHPWNIGQDESYYEYLLNPWQEQSSFSYPIYKYKISQEEPYAVVFMRVNFHKVVSIFFTGAKLTDQAMEVMPFYESSDYRDQSKVYYYNTVVLMPYDKLAENCDYIVGSEI